MKLHIRTMILLAVAVFMLTGCAVVPAVPAPAAVPVETEAKPIAVVPEARTITGPEDYNVTIYNMDPNANVDIPDESIPLAPAAEAPIAPAEGPVTKRQAEAMAIQLAGLTHDDVSFLFAKEDFEDGIQVYEVSFRSGNFAYEIEIAKDTAEVLSFDKEDWRMD